jgi:hypothetical protein
MRNAAQLLIKAPLFFTELFLDDDFQPNVFVAPPTSAFIQAQSAEAQPLPAL